MCNLIGKYKRAFLSLIIPVLLLGASMNSIAQSTQCGTPVGEDLITPQMMEDARNMRGGTYTVEIWVHSINENDGTGGPTYEEVLNELQDLEDYFAPHNICFAFMGYDKINNSTYASDPDFTGTDANNLIAAYPPNTSVLDMYILPSYTFYRGNAFAIPNHYLLIYAGRFNTAHLSHETGHCLGLYHTHETAFGVECPNGSNGNTAGDKCLDTPADDDGGWSQSPCSYTGGGFNCGQAINASPLNIMSYAPYACKNIFTADQRARMYSNLASSGTLAPLLVNSATASLGASYQSGESFWSRSSSITCINTYDAGGSAYVTLNAGDYIQLNDGVTITPNSTGHFMATVNQCNFALIRLAEDEESDEQGIIADASLNVYPNPSTGQISIKFDVTEQASVSLYITDISGRTVSSIMQNETVISGNYMLEQDLGYLASGMYMCVLRKGDEVSTTRIAISK